MQLAPCVDISRHAAVGVDGQNDLAARREVGVEPGAAGLAFGDQKTGGQHVQALGGRDQHGTVRDGHVGHAHVNGQRAGHGAGAAVDVGSDTRIGRDGDRPVVGGQGQPLVHRHLGGGVGVVAEQALRVGGHGGARVAQVDARDGDRRVGTEYGQAVADGADGRLDDHVIHRARNAGRGELRAGHRARVAAAGQRHGAQGHVAAVVRRGRPRHRARQARHDGLERQHR